MKKVVDKYKVAVDKYNKLSHLSRLSLNKIFDQEHHRIIHKYKISDRQVIREMDDETLKKFENDVDNILNIQEENKFIKNFEDFIGKNLIYL